MSRIQPVWPPDETRDSSSVLLGWSLRREIEMLLRSRYIIGGCIAASLFLAAAYNYGTRPLYEAVSVISLDQAGSSPLKAFAPLDELRRTAALQLQVGFLTSPDLARFAVADPDPELAAELAKGPLGGWRERIVEEALFFLGFPTAYGTSVPDFADAFRSRLSVEHEPPSTWVYIRFRGYDAHAPVLAIQRLIDIYMAETRKRTEGFVGETQQALERRLEERKGRVVETLDKLKEFEQKQGLRNVESNRQALERELARLQDSLITARQTRLARKALADETAGLSGAEMLAIPAMRDDREVAEGTARIADLESRIARQSATFGDLHPEIVALRAELKLARERRDARLQVLRDATNRDYRLSAREEADIGSMIKSTQVRLAALDVNSVERSFIQRQAAAGQRAVGELIEREVRQADLDVFFEPTVLQDPASSPSPVSPQRGRNFQYALAVGLLAGLLLSWVRSHLDETLKTPEDVKALFPLPLLGMVPRIHRSGFDLLGAEEGKVTRLFEAYRVLRTNLMLSPEAPKSRPIVLITSSRAGDGKTTTACGLAVVMAQAGLKVLLVDGDLRRASLSRLFSVRDGLGLSDVLDGKPAPECIVAPVVPGLSLLPAGTFRPNPAELLNREGLLSAMDSIRPNYDWILCDAPPILAVADAAILARIADQVLLVIGANATPSASVRASLEQLETVGAGVRGLILNRVDLSRDSHYYRYYYGDKYEDYSDPSHRGAGRA